MEEKDPRSGELRQQVALLEQRVQHLERGIRTALALLAAVALVVGSFLPWIVEVTTDDAGGDLTRTFRLGTYAVRTFAEGGAADDGAVALFGIAFGVLALTTIGALLALGVIAVDGHVPSGLRSALSVLLVCCMAGASLVTLMAASSEGSTVHWGALGLWCVGAALAFVALRPHRPREPATPGTA